MSSSTENTSLRIEGIEFQGDQLCVKLSDGRVLSFPLSWYPRLRNASSTERSTYELLGGGIGVHWPLIDEDLSLEGFLQGSPAPGSDLYKKRKLEKEVYTYIDSDLAEDFPNANAVNEALREYRRLKK